FEVDDKKFVIEYQCTPIATEYFERKRLYDLNNITSIWILGTDNYKIHKKSKEHITHDTRLKVIEKETIKENLVYFDTDNDGFIIHSNLLNGKYNLISDEVKRSWSSISNIVNTRLYFRNYSNDHFCYFGKEETFFDNGELGIDSEVIMEMKSTEEENTNRHNKKIKLEEEKRFKEENFINNVEKEIIEVINNETRYIDTFPKLYIKNDDSDRYRLSIGFGTKCFLVKRNRVDFCSEYTYTKPKTNYKGNLQWMRYYGHHMIHSETYEENNVKELRSLIKKSLKETLDIAIRDQEEIDNKLQKLKGLLNYKINIIDTDYIIPSSIKFRFLKEAENNVDYIISDFANEIKKLKNRTNELTFLIKSHKCSYVEFITLLEKCGFTNVHKLDGCAFKK
ncbi:MAG: hypothetical protein WD512_17660, partial [Candidatus Paceibacterota bacterium]